MKQNIIMIFILIALFFFGLLIYDFSDEMDSGITSHEWYLYEGEKLTAIDFEDNEFSYYYVDTKDAVSSYDLCTTYRFNRSINVVKLNCSVTGNKIYISSFDDDTLTLKIEGEEKTFYASEDLASEAKFKSDNNLTDEEYDSLMNLDLAKYNYITVDEILDLYKSKDTKLVAFIGDAISIDNILNYEALDNILSTTDSTLVVINGDDLSSNEASKLSEISELFSNKSDSYKKDQIDVYQIGNKKVKLLYTIDVSNIQDIGNYSNN